jgi:GR25 family glycosyltransferase involved in LPS biosynthesis
MPVRQILTASIAVGAAGVVVLVLTWFDVIGWQYGESLAILLLLASLFLLGAAVLSTLKSVRADLRLIRNRSQSVVENTTRISNRVEEVRRELLLGSYSHVPGQIARMEGHLAKTGASAATQRRISTVPDTPNNAVDEVFVLNLDRDTEKMARTAKMLDENNIAFTRFPAVDGFSSEFDDEWAAYMDEGPQLPPEHYTGERLIESRGAWGYLKSMQAVLEHARSENLKSFLLLEDDLLFHNEFADRFTEAWAELPDDWKVVYLGSAQVDRSKITRYSDHLYHPGAMANGSYAVAFDASIYDQALASIARFDWPFDAGALREIDTAFPMNVFVVDPPLVIADVSESDIRPGRGLEAHADKHGWDLAEYHKPVSQL